MRPASGPLAPGARRRGRGGGFTLVELVVAVAIAAALLVAAPLALGPLRATAEYRAAVRGLLAGLREARLEAERSGRPVAFTVDLRARRFGVDDRLRGRLPDAVDVHLVVAGREVSGDRGAIRFYPDGSATGGSIELVRAGGGGLRLRVDWLLGRVSQELLGT